MEPTEQMQHLHVLNAAQTPLVRVERDQRSGRDILVAPVVAFKEGVLNGELVLASEIARFLGAWEDVPVPVPHPTLNGAPVSARTKDQADHAIGRFYNARLDGDAIKGELWIDILSATTAGGEAEAVVNRLRSGQPVEVSTAYWRDLELTTGDWHGKPYRGVAKNIRPDHLAVLLNTPGACSWADGCGAPRINAQDETDEQVQEDNVGQPSSETATDHIFGGLEDMAQNTTDAVEVPCEGCPDPAVNEATPDETTSAPLAPPVFTASPEYLALVEVVTEFGGIDEFKAAMLSLKTNADQEKAALVQALIANERSAFTTTDLAAMPLETVRKLHASLSPANYGGQGMPFSTNAAEWQTYTVPVVPVAQPANGKGA